MTVRKDAANMLEQRKLVERIMQRTGLSLSALATAADLSHTTLTRWWNNEGTSLSDRTIKRLLAVSPELETGSLDREAFSQAFDLVATASGIPKHRAQIMAAAALSLYRQLSNGDGFASPEEAHRAARLALDTAEYSIREPRD